VPGFGYVLSARWSRDGQSVVAGMSDGMVLVWRPDEPGTAPALLPKPHSGPIYGMAVSPDGKAVATGSVDRTLKVWDLGEKLIAHELPEVHRKPVYGVAYSPDGRFIATGSADTYLVVYDIAEVKKKAEASFGQEEYWHFAVRDRILNCVAWSPDGRRLAVGLSNHTVVVLPVTADGAVTKGPTLKGHEDSVSRVAWARGGERLVSAGYDRRVVVWSGKDFQPLLSRVLEHTQPIQALAVHPGGEVLATGSWDGSLRLYAMETLRPLGVYTHPHFSAVEDLDFSPDGRRLVSASSDGTLGVWRIAE
jgi:WD40 repeat protein